jgi:hypothetical protein
VKAISSIATSLCILCGSPPPVPVFRLPILCPGQPLAVLCNITVPAPPVTAPPPAPKPPEKPPAPKPPAPGLGSAIAKAVAAALAEAAALCVESGLCRIGQDNSRTLYRSMIATPAGMPQIGSTARSLGVRPGSPPAGDISVVAGMVQPGPEGMSVAPDSPSNLPKHRRPPLFGGTGKDPVFSIKVGQLGPTLAFVQDSPTHGVVSPASPMSLSAYQAALSATQPLWVQVIP